MTEKSCISSARYFLSIPALKYYLRSIEVDVLVSSFRIIYSEKSFEIWENK